MAADWTPEGELTIATAAACREALLVRPVDSIDASRITSMDGAGLQLLLMAAREARRRGVRLRVLAPSRSVRAVCALVRLDRDSDAWSVEAADA